MKTIHPFGFVTGCHRGDKFMVGATLASIRHYCPDTPICLVVDGDFDISDLQQVYNPIILRTSELPSVEMRNLIRGNTRAKLAAMWEGPFEYFVWLDSDAILWGDIMPFLNRDVDFQIFSKKALKSDSEDFVDESHPEVKEFSHFMFNPFDLALYDKDFKWRDNDYFCAGVFGVKKNAIDFSEWMEAERWRKLSPNPFQFDDQGIINYLVHKKRQAGQIRTVTSDLQMLRSPEEINQLKSELHEEKYNFPDKIKKPRIIHFCGTKPFLLNYKSYCHPFTIARLSHHKKTHSLIGSWMKILKEECRILIRKLKSRIKRPTN